MVKQAEGERNYHAFYQVFQENIPENVKNELKLTKITDYHYVNNQSRDRKDTETEREGEQLVSNNCVHLCF